MTQQQFRVLLFVIGGIGLTVILLAGAGVLWLVTHVQVVQNLQP